MLATRQIGRIFRWDFCCCNRKIMYFSFDDFYATHFLHLFEKNRSYIQQKWIENCIFTVLPTFSSSALVFFTKSAGKYNKSIMASVFVPFINHQCKSKLSMLSIFISYSNMHRVGSHRLHCGLLKGFSFCSDSGCIQAVNKKFIWK